MSQTEQLHRGSVIRHQGQLFTVLDFWASPSGKQRPTVHVQLRSIKKGHAAASNVTKETKLDSTILIRVPLLIQSGDRIRLKTAIPANTAAKNTDPWYIEHHAA
jgi:translation elongation factor P/translation initiation factor 5A